MMNLGIVFIDKKQMEFHSHIQLIKIFQEKNIYSLLESKFKRIKFLK